MELKPPRPRSLWRRAARKKARQLMPRRGRKRKKSKRSNRRAENRRFRRRSEIRSLIPGPLLWRA